MQGRPIPWAARVTRKEDTMFGKFRQFVEESPWETILEDGNRWLDTFCVVMSLASLVYLGGRWIVTVILGV